MEGLETRMAGLETGATPCRLVMLWVIQETYEEQRWDLIVQHSECHAFSTSPLHNCGLPLPPIKLYLPALFPKYQCALHQSLIYFQAPSGLCEITGTTYNNMTLHNTKLCFWFSCQSCRILLLPSHHFKKKYKKRVRYKKMGIKEALTSSQDVKRWKRTRQSTTATEMHLFQSNNRAQRVNNYGIRQICVGASVSVPGARKRLVFLRNTTAKTVTFLKREEARSQLVCALSWTQIHPEQKFKRSCAAISYRNLASTDV